MAPDTATLTALGQTTQVRVTARYADGSVYDVSARSRFTSYRVSNPAIATLDDDGVLTARAKGMVYVTAMNEGATGVAQVDVSPGDPLTTLTGVIQTTNGLPAGGAVISIVGQPGRFAVTRADGSFVLTNVLTGFGLAQAESRNALEDGCA